MVDPICDFCGKNTQLEYVGITWKGDFYCVSCFELISGKKAQLKCLN